MICPACQEEVSSFTAYRQVGIVRTIDVVDNKAFCDPSFTISIPRGKPSYTFRCACGADLTAHQRECLSLMKQGERK